ncbi:hypothetical protein FACS1894181_14690 [Bacteroidia bacterium]|nr:hypothetical protein FACS1894181_14690 [Bacteroidia bacterium]
MKKYSIYILIIMALCSCVGEEIPAHETQPSLTDRQLTLVMQIPGTNAPVTFAYSPSGENEVRTVDILVFKVDSKGEHYYKHIPVRSIRDDNNTTKKVDIALEAIDTRLILLANVNHLFTEEMTYLLENDAKSGDVTKEIILDRFMFDFKEQWKAGDHAGNAFPMYGESGIVPAKSAAVNEIKMIRAIARIDIANDARNAGWSIDSVYVFNTNDKGFVAPSFDKRGTILETPHVPSAAKANAKSFGYLFVPNAGTTTLSMEREIYVAEDMQDSGTPTSIVLRILHEGKKPQYYRVDLKGTDGELMPLLRNYRYRIFITGITGDGYLTAEEAATAAKRTPISSEVEIDELGLEKIIFNDQYKLGVSELQVAFHADGSWMGMEPGETSYSLKVYTTYSNWSVSMDESLAAWLKFDGSNGDGLNAEFPASCHSLGLIAEANTSGLHRSGTIYLRAGTLRFAITVLQNGNSR